MSQGHLTKDTLRVKFRAKSKKNSAPSLGFFAPLKSLGMSRIVNRGKNDFHSIIEEN